MRTDELIDLIKTAQQVRQKNHGVRSDTRFFPAACVSVLDLLRVLDARPDQLAQRSRV